MAEAAREVAEAEGAVATLAGDQHLAERTTAHNWQNVSRESRSMMRWMRNLALRGLNKEGKRKDG